MHCSYVTNSYEENIIMKECFDSTMSDDSDSADDFEEPRPNTSGRRRSSHRSGITSSCANTDDVMSSSQGVYCRICEKYFENHEQLISHIYTHAPNPSQDVSDTGEESVEEEDEEEDGEEAHFKCKLCDSKFPDREKGMTHLKKCHGDVFGLHNKAHRKKASSNGTNKECDNNDTEDLPRVSLKPPRKSPGSAKSLDSVRHMCTICDMVFPTTHYANVHRHQKHSDAHLQNKTIFIKVTIPKSGLNVLQRRRRVLPEQRMRVSKCFYDKYLTKNTKTKFKPPSRGTKQSTRPEPEEEIEREERLSKTINPDAYIKYVDNGTKHKDKRKRKSGDVEAATIKRRKTKPDNTNEPETLYLCLKCKLHFDNEHKFQQHYTKCNKLDSNDCAKCGLTFSVNELTQHTIRHHSSDKQTHFKVIQVKSPNGNGKKHKLYKCGLCDDHFLRISAVYSHVYRRESRAHPTTGKLCTICQYVFPSITLKQHVEIHHNIQRLRREDFVVKVIQLNSNDDEKSRAQNVRGEMVDQCQESFSGAQEAPNRQNDGLTNRQGNENNESEDEDSSDNPDSDNDWDINCTNKDLPPVMRKKPQTKINSDLPRPKAKSKTVHRKCLTCNENMGNFEDGIQGICETCAKETRSTRNKPIEPQQQSLPSTSEGNTADGNYIHLLFKCNIRQRDLRTQKVKECNIHFDSYRALQHHMSHALCDSEVKSLCITCDKYFVACHQLTRHVNMFHKNQQLSCSDFKVVTESDLTNHAAGNAQPAVASRSSAKNPYPDTSGLKDNNARPQDQSKSKPGSQSETSVSARDNTKSKQHIDKEKENKHSNPTPKEHSEINGGTRKSTANTSRLPQSTEKSVKKQASNKSVDEQNKTPHQSKDQTRIPTEIADSHNKPKASTSNTKTVEENKPTTTYKIPRKAKDKETSTNAKEDNTKNSAASEDRPNNASTQGTGKGILDSILEQMGPRTYVKVPTNPNSTQQNVVVTDVRIINPFKSCGVTSDVLGNTAASHMKSLQTSQFAITTQNTQAHTDSFNVTPTIFAVRDPRQSNFGHFTHDYNHVSLNTDHPTADNSKLPIPEYTVIDPNSSTRNTFNTSNPLNTQTQNSYNLFRSNCNYDTNWNSNYGRSVKPNRIISRRKTTEWGPSEDIALPTNTEKPKPKRIEHRSRSLSGRHIDDSLDRSRNDRDTGDNHSTKHNTRYPSGTTSSSNTSRSFHRSKSRSGSPKSSGLPYNPSKPRYYDHYYDRHNNSYENRYSPENYGNGYYSRPSLDTSYNQTGYNHRYNTHYNEEYDNYRDKRNIPFQHIDSSNRSVRYENKIRRKYEPSKKMKMHFFKCKKCRVYFVTKRECEGHIDDHIESSNVNTKANYVECSICFLKIDILAIDIHKETHHDDERYDQRFVNVTEYILKKNDLPVYEKYVMDLETEATNERKERKRKRRPEQLEVEKKRARSSYNGEGTRNDFGIKKRTHQKEITTDTDNSKTRDLISKNNITRSSEPSLKPVVDEVIQNSSDIQSKVNQLDMNTREDTSNMTRTEPTTFNSDQSPVQTNDTFNDSSLNDTDTIVNASILGLEKVRIMSVITLSNETSNKEDNQSSIENLKMPSVTSDKCLSNQTDHTTEEVLESRNDTSIEAEAILQNTENDNTQPSVIDNTNNAETIKVPDFEQDQVTSVENNVDTSCNASESLELTTLVNSKLNSIDSSSPQTYEVMLDDGIEDKLHTPPIVDDKPQIDQYKIKTIEPPNLEDEDTLLLCLGDSIPDSEIGEELMKSKDEENVNQSIDDTNLIQNLLSKVNVPLNTRVNIELKPSEETQTITVTNQDIDDKDTRDETLSQSSSQEETVLNIEKFIRTLKLLEQPGNNQNKIEPVVYMDRSTNSGRELQDDQTVRDDKSKEVDNNITNNVQQLPQITKDNIFVETITEMDPIVSQNEQELASDKVNDQQLSGDIVLFTNTDQENAVNKDSRYVKNNLAFTSIKEIAIDSRATSGESNNFNELEENYIGSTRKECVTPVLDINQEHLNGVINSKSVNSTEPSRENAAKVIETDSSTLPSCNDINTDQRLVQDVPNVSDTNISAVAQNSLSYGKSLHLIIDKLTKKVEDTNKVIEELPNVSLDAQYEEDSGTDSDNTQDYDYDTSCLEPVNSTITHISREIDGNTSQNAGGDDDLENNEHTTRIIETKDGETKITNNEENITDTIVINNDYDANKSDDDVIFVEKKEVIYQISDDENDSDESCGPKVDKYLNYTCPDVKVRKSSMKQSDIRKFIAMKKEKTECNQSSTVDGKNETISAIIKENPNKSVERVDMGEVVVTVDKAVSTMDEVVAISDDEDEVGTRNVKTEPSAVNKLLTVTGYIEID